MVPVRQAFAGSVQTLQALCGDCHSEKTLRESAQPTSLESRVAPGVMEWTCAKDSTYVGVDDPRVLAEVDEVGLQPVVRPLGG